MKQCDVAHSIHYSATHEAAFDLGRYTRIVGLPRKVRYLCEDCAKGRISPAWQARLRIAR